MSRNTTLDQARIQALIDSVYEQIDQIAKNLTLKEALLNKQILKLMNSIDNMKKEKDSI